MITHWRNGNRLELLENGEAYYPRLFAAIAAAREEVLVETFILFDDPVGRQFRDAAIAAARRGAAVRITIDGFGSADLDATFTAPLLEAGVHIHVYDPVQRLFGQRTRIFRRLHRKLAVIDRRLAFCGGINLSHDHLRDFGEQSKQDYALQIEGPVVADIHRTMLEVLAPPPRRWRWLRRQRLAPVSPQQQPQDGPAVAAVVIRDNDRHRADIERLYRLGIRAARHDIVIANAYFFPGYRLLRDLRHAARRGVRVRVILQGNPDMRFVQWAANTLHDYLLHAGVRIYEYCERPMHAKVALIDGDWLTVGSSNLDPLSLFLNLEANVFARDHGAAAALRDSLEHLLAAHCREIDPATARRRTLVRQLLSYLAYHATRRLPAFAGWLPAHAPTRATLPQAAAGEMREP
ncbi:cardiolipin synthase ClsB [Solimonas variicoloris]|uniref:cardiolipin synthase ClsB n=1 Tax=Solimonas variicoloris TaxID=254408 RepID=UPI000364E416|nr:cardiolipin synthase ClsB [Solimonas variicoloris]